MTAKRDGTWGENKTCTKDKRWMLHYNPGHQILAEKKKVTRRVLLRAQQRNRKPSTLRKKRGSTEKGSTEAPHLDELAGSPPERGSRPELPMKENQSKQGDTTGDRFIRERRTLKSVVLGREVASFKVDEGVAKRSSYANSFGK